MTNFEDLKKGDKIWTLQNGWTEVTDIVTNSYYPIIVHSNCYTIDGKYGIRDKYPSIYFHDPLESKDDFAIGFAEWLIKYPDKGRNFHGEIVHAKGRVGETYLTKELLEIYKKEKGL